MKILRISLAALFCLLFVLCPASVKKAEHEPLKEGDDAEWIPYDYDLSEYVLLGDLSAVEAEFEDPAVCTEAEVDAAVFQILLRHASFEEKNGPAERYNKVRFDFSLVLDENVLEEYSQSDYDLVIGMETGNPMETLLGETLMGARPGETRSVEYRYPEAVIGEELSGKTVTLYAKVKAVYQQTIPELIDDFVQKMEGSDLQTVMELREEVRGDLLEEKEVARGQAVWLAILEDATILSYPERELADTMELYRLYYENLAEMYEVEFDDFLAVYLKLTRRALKRRCARPRKRK